MSIIGWVTSAELLEKSVGVDMQIVALAQSVNGVITRLSTTLEQPPAPVHTTQCHGDGCTAGSGVYITPCNTHVGSSGGLPMLLKFWVVIGTALYSRFPISQYGTNLD